MSGIKRVLGFGVNLSFDDRELFYRIVEEASSKPGCDDQPGLSKDRMYELEREMFREGRNPGVCPLIRAGLIRSREHYGQPGTTVVTEKGERFYEENRDEFRITPN